MPDQPSVAVRGEAVLEVEPEIARLTVTVAARDSDRRKVLRLMHERLAAVDAVIADFGDAVEKVETSSMQVSPQLKSYKPKERIAGYVGIVRHSVTVTGFERLGDLVARLADQELTEVAGPSWALRPDSTVYRQARAAAVGDAVQRARDYAQALGTELTSVVELADAELLSRAMGYEPTASAGAATPLRLRSAEPEEVTIDLEPAKQVVRATVEARFRISEPDLAGRDYSGGATGSDAMSASG